MRRLTTILISLIAALSTFAVANTSPAHADGGGSAYFEWAQFRWSVKSVSNSHVELYGLVKDTACDRRAPALSFQFYDDEGVYIDSVQIRNSRGCNSTLTTTKKATATILKGKRSGTVKVHKQKCSNSLCWGAGTVPSYYWQV